MFWECRAKVIVCSSHCKGWSLVWHWWKNVQVGWTVFFSRLKSVFEKDTNVLRRIKEEAYQVSQMCQANFGRWLRKLTLGTKWVTKVPRTDDKITLPLVGWLRDPWDHVCSHLYHDSSNGIGKTSGFTLTSIAGNSLVSTSGFVIARETDEGDTRTAGVCFIFFVSFVLQVPHGKWDTLFQSKMNLHSFLGV